MTPNLGAGAHVLELSEDMSVAVPIPVPGSAPLALRFPHRLPFKDSSGH